MCNTTLRKLHPTGQHTAQCDGGKLRIRAVSAADQHDGHLGAQNDTGVLGVAEQIGTPVEVYEKPASLFVASFIGSPAMNLLTGRVNNEGTHFELDGGIELPLNGGYRQYAGRKMTLGIRPEHIALSSQAEGGVPMVMDTLEILGADNLAHGRWGEQKLVVRLAHQERPTAGSTLWLHLPENQLHLFDGETGQRV